VLVAAPRELWRVHTATDQVSSLHRAAELAYVGWTQEGQPFWAPDHGRLSVSGDPRRLVELGVRPRHVRIEGDELITLLDDGRLAEWSLSDEKILHERRVCGGDPRQAVRQRGDDIWLVTCGPRAPHTFEVLGGILGSGDTYGSEGDTWGAAAWSMDGRFFVTPAPPHEGESAALWDALRGVPVATVGHAPLQSAEFSPDGQRLLGVSISGEVFLWDLDAARHRHPVLRPRR
jgi:WD40 repeat protein